MSYEEEGKNLINLYMEKYKKAMDEMSFTRGYDGEGTKQLNQVELEFLDAVKELKKKYNKL